MARQRFKAEQAGELTECATPLLNGVASLSGVPACTTDHRSALQDVEKPSSQTATGGENRVAGHRAPVRDASSSLAYQTLKRGLDCFVSLTGLLFFAPLFVAIAVAIRLTSAGPVLFRQERFGENLKPFTFYKFRSMYANADEAIHKAYVARLIAGCPDVPNATVLKKNSS